MLHVRAWVWPADLRTQHASPSNPYGRQLPEPLPGHSLWVWVPQRSSEGPSLEEWVPWRLSRSVRGGFNLAAFKMTSFLSEPAASPLTTPRGQELGLCEVLNPRAWHTVGAQLCWMTEQHVLTRVCVGLCL